MGDSLLIVVAFQIVNWLIAYGCYNHREVAPSRSSDRHQGVPSSISGRVIQGAKSRQQDCSLRCCRNVSCNSFAVRIPRNILPRALVCLPDHAAQPAIAAKHLRNTFCSLSGCASAILNPMRIPEDFECRLFGKPVRHLKWVGFIVHDCSLLHFLVFDHTVADRKLADAAALPNDDSL
jgi:hypothetical protein